MRERESRENYLETIYILNEKKGNVHSVDVARELGYSKPSISRAVSLLKKEGKLEVASDGTLILTESGLAEAEAIYEKHKVLTEFLMVTAKVNSAVAEETACRMEHILSEEVYKGIKKFLKK